MEQLVNQIIESLKLSDNEGYKDGIAFEGYQGDCSNGQIVMTFIKSSNDTVNIQWNLAQREQQTHIYSLYEVQAFGGINFNEILKSTRSDEELKTLNHIRVGTGVCEALIKDLVNKTMDWSNRFQIASGFDFNNADSFPIHQRQFNLTRH